MPTVLDLLGVPTPKEVTGTSLVPLMTGAAAELGLDAYSESMYPLHHYGWSDLRALRAGRYKVIDAPRPELYDIEEDPKEAANLYDAAAGAWRQHARPAAGSASRASRRRRLRCRPETSTRKPGRGWRRSGTSARLSPARRIRGRAGPIPRTRSASSTGWAKRWSWPRKAMGTSRTMCPSPRPRRC